MSGYIHILKGTGSNCTCSDCIVLYGGECFTTPINDFLDTLEKKIRSVSKNEGKMVSKADIHRALEIIRSPIKKKYKITDDLYDEIYYGFMPLIIFIANGYLEGKKNNYDKGEARRLYKKARMFLLADVEKNIENHKK